MIDPNDPNRIINYRPLFIAAVGLIAGILGFEAYQSLRVGRLFEIIIPVAAAALASALCIIGIVQRKPVPALLLFAFLIGAARTALAVPSALPSGECLISGTVESYSDVDRGIIVLRSVAFDGKSFDAKLKLTLSEEAELPSIGDRISFVSEVGAPRIKFGTYDERTSLLGNGIAAKAKAEGYEKTGEGLLPVLKKLYEIRYALIDRIHLVFGENASIVSGFLLGEKSGVDESDMESFRATGTAHLLTLSGFHVALFTALLFFVLPKRFPWLRFCITGIALLFYCAISAFAPSIVRASIMCGCMMLSEVTERRRDLLSALSLALIIILAFSPYKLYSLGFKLSFAATYGIIVMMSFGSPGKESMQGRILGILLATLGATAATALISARSFGVFSTYGLLANVTAVPIFSAAVTLSFAVLLLGLLFPAAAVYAAWLPNQLINLAMLILRGVGSLPYARIDVIAPSNLSGILMLLLMFSVSAFILRPPKSRLRIALPVFLLFTASIIADIIRA